MDLKCNFINIQQRTKTIVEPVKKPVQCNFINIQQRTKTMVTLTYDRYGVILSISNRELKPIKPIRAAIERVILSISNRELNEHGYVHIFAVV